MEYVLEITRKFIFHTIVDHRLLILLIKDYIFKYSKTSDLNL